MTDETAETQSLDEEVALQLAEGLSDFERHFYISNNGIAFRGKTLEAWSKEVVIPSIDNVRSTEDLERFNHIVLEMTEVIMSNLSYAKSSFDMIRLQYKSRKRSEIYSIVNSYRNQDTSNNRTRSRMPSAEVVRDMAESNISELYTSYKLAELFYEFWKNQYDKLKLVDSRLTSLNILRNVESRYASR